MGYDIKKYNYYQLERIDVNIEEFTTDWYLEVPRAECRDTDISRYGSSKILVSVRKFVE